MGEFLHGSETERNTADTVSIQDGNSSAVVLIGFAPIFEVEAEYQTTNEVVLIQNTSSPAKYFGKTHDGFTIPHALEDFYKQGGGKVFVINIFDSSKHKETISVSKTFANGKIELENKLIYNLVVADAEADKDYTYENGIITATKDGKLKDAAEVAITYDIPDVSKVTPADILGGIDSDGKKTGAELINDIKAIFGIRPSIIIAPALTCLNQVKTGLQVIADKLNAYLYVDAPLNTTLDDVIKGRGLEGTINFNTSSELCNLYHHHYKVYNKTENKYEYRYASPFIAGLRVNLDRTKGLHYSSSNHAIKGVEGVDVPVSFELNDFDCDANVLNSYGVNTTINVNGEYRAWGNRNASFPSKNGIMTFECCVREIITVENAINDFTLNEIDGPITTALVDRILQNVRNYFNTKIQKNEIIDGEIWFDKEKNPVSQIADGYLVFSYASCPPPPFERAKYIHDIKIQYLEKIGGNQ